MTRFLLATLFGIGLLAVNAENCEAQLFRGRFQRPQATQKQNVAPPLFVKPAGHVGWYQPQDYSAPSVFPGESYFENRKPMISRLLDGPMTHKYRNPAEVDSRYIGGFHQSHFQNIGIPSGDIGLRGNAYDWRTW